MQVPTNKNISYRKKSQIVSLQDSAKSLEIKTDDVSEGATTIDSDYAILQMDLEATCTLKSLPSKLRPIIDLAQNWALEKANMKIKHTS